MNMNAPTLGVLRQPWLLLSLGVHALVLGVMAHWGVAALQTRQAQRVEAALSEARQAKLQRHLAQIEAAARELGVASEPAPPGADEPALRERARALHERVQARLQDRRAEELAQLLRIPKAEAVRRLQAERRERPAAQTVAQMAQQARDAQAQARSAAQGRALRMAPGGGAGASPGAGAGAVAGAGPGAGGGAGGAPGVGQAERDPNFHERRLYGAMHSVPPRDLPDRPGLGRQFGPGGPWATRVFLDRWYVAGPFAAHGQLSLEERLAPELAPVDLDDVFEGKGGRLLQWQLQQAAHYPFVPEPRVANAVYYAWTEIELAQAQTLWIEIGADDDSKLWLNGRLLWTSQQGDKPWYRQPFTVLHPAIAEQGLVESRVRVHLPAGKHQLLFKLLNGEDLMFFSVVLTPA